MITPSFDNIKIGDILIWKTDGREYKVTKKERGNIENHYVLYLATLRESFDCNYSDIELNIFFKLAPRPDKEIDILDYV